MGNAKIREPIQNRSIDTKNKIIEAAYDIFSEVGYYNTTTTQISKKAKVSTGIVYGYFKDKKDILMYVIDIYIDKVANPVMEYINNLKNPIDINKIITEIIDLTIKIHQDNFNLHNILHSLTASNEEINKKFIALEDHITINATNILRSLDININNLTEKVHITMNSIQSFCHEYIYDRHEYIDYEKMKVSTIEMICNLLK